MLDCALGGSPSLPFRVNTAFTYPQQFRIPPSVSEFLCTAATTILRRRAILTALGGDDWTVDERPAAEDTELARQRVWCVRNVISLARDVSKRPYLAVLLGNLRAPVASLHTVAAAALHQLSSTNLGARARPRTQCSTAEYPLIYFFWDC